MKYFNLFFLSAIICLLSINEANASHMAGGQITYTHTAGLTYNITYTFYRDCGGVAAPGNVTINTASANAGVNFNTVSGAGVNNGNVVPVSGCPPTTCSGGATPGREKWVYTASITLPSQQTDWIFSVAVNARNAGITTSNASGQTMYVESLLNNVITPGNNACFFANDPAAFTYINQPFCFNNGAVDIDGDSLVYSLVDPLIGAGNPITWNGGYSATQPVASTPPVTFNTATGDVCMTPTLIEVTVIAIVVQEYRYGILIGSVTRDIQVMILGGADNLPALNGINGTNAYVDTAVVGCAYTFTTSATDANAAQCVTMTSSVAASIPAASFVVANGCPSLTRPTGTFNWTPTPADALSYPNYFTVTVRDNFCNINGQQVKAYGIFVINLNANFTSTAPACVGQNVNFYAEWTLSNYSYLWNFGAGSVATFAMATSANPVGVQYTTSGSKTVVLTITTPGGCVITNSQVITVNPSPTSSFTSTAPQCVGTAIDFTNTGTTGAGTTFSWDFGSGSSPATSTSENPTGVMYSSSGQKVVTLITTNNFGCVTTSTQTITISATPVASFTSTAPKCTGANVDFTNTGTVVGVIWSWNFGSGATPATSTLQSPTGITYSVSGIKVVTLTTTNLTTGCTNTYSTTININQTPTSSFISNAPQCANTGINFTNTGSSGGQWSYFWDFGVGAMPQTSIAQNPSTVLYSTAGTKTITLTISDANCSATSTQIITVNPSPVASFSSNAPMCTGDTVNFQNTGTSSATYAWTFGSGSVPSTSTTQSPTGVIYNTSGIKTVTLITTLGGCTDTSVQTILINQTPNVSFTSTAPQCVGNAVNFSNTGSTGGNWTFSWSFGAGATPAASSSENPNGVMYATAGTKTVTLTISDGTCSNTTTQTININALPTANAGADTVICNNTSVQIGSASVAGYTYNWFPSSTLNNSAIADPIASPIAPSTIYIVTVTETATGCMNTDSVVVNMLAPLNADAGNDVEICRYDSIQIGAALVTGQNYAWSPSAGLNSTVTPNPVCSPSVTTTYTLSVTGPGCGPVMDEVTVTVHPLPIADAGPNDTITVGSSTQLTATGGIQYTWTPSTGLSNVSIYNPIANPTVTTTYYVTVTDVFGCVNIDSMTVTVIEPNFWLPTAFTPNGDQQNDVLYAHGEGIDNFELGVYNRWGELIWSTKDIMVGWDGRRQIGGQELPEGAYVYYVKGDLSDGTVIDKSGLINLIR